MKWLSLVLIFFYSPLLYSQQTNNIPDFGQVSKEDMVTTECDFDKNAEAFVLFDVEDLQCKMYPGSIYLKLRRHIRLKILNDKGLDQANIKIPYFSYSEGEDVTDLNAQTYNLDAAGNIVITRLDKKAIFNKKVNKIISEKIFAFPEVRSGSIIEYTYTVNGPIRRGLKNWNFQKAIPVKLSRYTLDFPTEIVVYPETITLLPVERENKIEKNRVVKIFTMKDIPALRDEPFISCEEDYVQRVESRIGALYVSGRLINFESSWTDIVNDMIADEDFGTQLAKMITPTDDLETHLRKVEDPYKKMNVIYRYVQNNMEWNGFNNIWALNGVKNAWKDKKGNTAEINLILIDLLRASGLEVYPLLVSTHENGRINTRRPGANQFDKVMAYVTIKDKVFVLDATDKYGSPRLIPWEVMNSKGLVIKKTETREWQWYKLWDERQLLKDAIVVNAEIDDQGNMKGWATIASSDYSRSRRLKDLKKGKAQFVEKYLTSPNPGVRVDSFSIENEAEDSLPLTESFVFSHALSSSGDYKYFSLNLFSGLEKNPFVANARFSDIFFGADQQYSVLGTYYIPEGFSFDALPKNVALRMPDSSIIFTRHLDIYKESFTVHINLQFNKPVFSVEEYDNVREFYKKLYDLLNEQVVIKRNPTNEKS